MSEPATEQKSDNFTDLPVGEILRRTRVHYNRSIEDVESALRIQAKQIQAIETGDLSVLPARVYAIGFVRSYAEYLGLDGEKIVDLFKAQTGHAPAEPKLQFPEAPQTFSTPPLWVFVTIAAILCAILVGFLFNGSKPDIEPEPVPEVPAELTVEALEEKQATVPEPEPEQQEASQPAAEQPKGIVLKMLSNSWVEIRDQNNRKLISRVLEAGDQYFVPDRLDLSMSIGNAGGVEILVDGIALENIGESGQVLRNIPLNAGALKERFPFSAQMPVETSAENQ